MPDFRYTLDYDRTYLDPAIGLVSKGDVRTLKKAPDDGAWEPAKAPHASKPKAQRKPRASRKPKTPAETSPAAETPPAEPHPSETTAHATSQTEE